jgi:hypothetical protein
MDADAAECDWLRSAAGEEDALAAQRAPILGGSKD